MRQLEIQLCGLGRQALMLVVKLVLVIEVVFLPLLAPVAPLRKTGGRSGVVRASRWVSPAYA